ncbi:MAG: aminotransferase class I/II-fold pyridoxal phosphate-dependent enzyme [Gemmatimonadetes bacterium]|nr:aminotransferase class I/II-fold pyridoxal phosphate-dependent enzyme [Gemmatimonadota bacterium]MDA1103154.1 aminotransferase class I/II-fold pyridoxal phosphate-dependent enzyme [Gemmatimonadota bacterium]
MRYTPFRMERWQSTHEHRVEINLSESGVHPLTVGELVELSDRDIDLDTVLLGYGQSNGSDELRSLISGQYPGTSDASILVTVGGAEANFTCFWHLFEKDAKAAIVLPTYGQVPGLLESFGSRLSPVQLVEAEGWQPDLKALEAALVDGARFVLITNPNNPTGAALTRSSMDAIAELTERHEAWILSDEVYAGAEAGPERTPSFWGCHDRVLVTNSLSKAYGLPGLRLGWIVGPDALISELWGRTDYTTICPASVSDSLACLALEPDTRARIGERTRGIVRANLSVLKDWMDQQGGRFRYRAPDAGAICYTRYDAEVNSTDFAEKLRSEKSVLVVPGDHFGMDHYLRLGFGNPEDELLEGLGRVREAFDEVTG